MLYVVVAFVVVLVVFIAYNALRVGEGSGWTYSQLLTQAKGGNVRSVVIDGQEATVTDRQGHRHQVNLPSDTAVLANTLSGEGVNVTYTTGAGSDWPEILIPNLVLLLLIGGFIWWMVRRSRPRGPGGPL